jgi:D-amino-acid dehydrogenase
VKPVVIIGGGVIGLCTAYSLQQRDIPVIVLDAGPVEQAASHVNAGWIVPAMSEPVPAPGLIATSLRWMLRSDSPLFIDPRAMRDPAFMRWTLRFWRHCNRDNYQQGVHALAAFGQRAILLYDAMRVAGVSYEEHRDGVLFAYRSPAVMERDYAALDTIRSYGYKVSPLLNGNILREMEPALSETVQGGYLFPDERSVRPDSLVRGLTAYLRERGVENRSGSPVSGIETTNGRATAVVINGKRIAAETVVVAAGAWTGALLRPLHADVPVVAGKGYSIDLSPQPVSPPVSRPLYLHETRVAVTPLNGMIRLAGTMEFSGLNHHLRPERIAAIASSAAWAIRGWPAVTPTSGPGVTCWAGPRPMTPDGLPVIGWLPHYRGIAVASGHSMAGVGLAPITGEAIAEIIATGTPPEGVAAFDPARFEKGGRGAGG